MDKHLKSEVTNESFIYETDQGLCYIKGNNLLSIWVGVELTSDTAITGVLTPTLKFQKANGYTPDVERIKVLEFIALVMASATSGQEAGNTAYKLGDPTVRYYYREEQFEERNAVVLYSVATAILIALGDTPLEELKSRYLCASSEAVGVLGDSIFRKLGTMKRYFVTKDSMSTVSRMIMWKRSANGLMRNMVQSGIESGAIVQKTKPGGM